MVTSKFFIWLIHYTNNFSIIEFAEIYDDNFPCNGADEYYVEAWSHNGRQVMYSVYLDETVEDMVYVFVNINDNICKYHIKYDEIINFFM